MTVLGSPEELSYFGQIKSFNPNKGSGLSGRQWANLYVRLCMCLLPRLWLHNLRGLPGQRHLRAEVGASGRLRTHRWPVQVQGTGGRKRAVSKGRDAPRLSRPAGTADELCHDICRSRLWGQRVGQRLGEGGLGLLGYGWKRRLRRLRSLDGNDPPTLERIWQRLWLVSACSWVLAHVATTAGYHARKALEPGCIQILNYTFRGRAVSS